MTDNKVPTFDNSQAGYREYRKRALLFRTRMRLERKENLTAVLLLSSLSGTAWETVETLADDPDNLESAAAFDKLLALLDVRFKFDAKTELPDAFEAYFYKSERKPKETMFDYVNRFVQLTRRVGEFNIKLPDEVQGWMLMRKAGLTTEQRQLIMAQVGTNLAFAQVSQVLQTTLGQQHTTDDHRKRQKEAYYQDDDDIYYDDDPDDVYFDEHFDGESYDDTDWDDSAADYYAEDAAGDWDVTEYDEIYTNYVDARRRMTDLKLARGFFPVVALGPESATSSAPRSSKSAGKSRGTGSKGKSKGKF